ncbi:STAS domain-containing protein [Peribacillus alkalitolerans]|uniref:STAS domain-containing protein n=1 Tax=Peribacillus alkalitolerans TaxID=1550385 RepID=UPI0013D09D7C|nr:STAS domain-containing protein [Peribacillus alkalitolerans]
MDVKARALYDYLVDHATEFTEEWFTYQTVKTGSDYSLDAPPHVISKIKEQNSQYVRFLAQSLLQTEEEMKDTISDWTSKTAADRVQSKTSLDEVARNNGVFRRVYWEYIKKFVKETDLNIELDDVFYWEKKLNYALDYVLETFIAFFMEIMINRLTSQATLIRELSTPVITLTNKVGLLPIIGEIDTTRAKSILESTLTQAVKARVTILIIDLSGVVMVDTMVAQQVFQLIDSLRIVGIKAILTGIRPEVAQTSIQLGIDFSGIQTENSLQKVISQLAKTNGLCFFE